MSCVFMENSLDSILKQTFRAAIFDYDGTLTDPHFGSQPPQELCLMLQRLSREIPMALCSGRVLSHALPKLQLLLGEHFSELQKNWFLFLENGGVGYRFENGEYVEMYHVAWPEMLFPKAKFDELIQEFFAGKVDYIDLQPSCVVMSPLHYHTLAPAELLEAVDDLEKMASEFFEKYELNSFLRIGNSAVGLIFYGKDGDKDRGTQEFGKLLGLSVPYREILAVGDRPVGNGNDRAFLCGEFGTPFTVGDVVGGVVPGGNLPYPVMSGDTRMTGPLATLHLLEQLHFSSSSPILPPLS